MTTRNIFTEMPETEQRDGHPSLSYSSHNCPFRSAREAAHVHNPLNNANNTVLPVRSLRQTRTEEWLHEEQLQQLSKGIMSRQGKGTSSWKQKHFQSAELQLLRYHRVDQQQGACTRGPTLFAALVLGDAFVIFWNCNSYIWQICMSQIFFSCIAWIFRPPPPTLEKISYFIN